MTYTKKAAFQNLGTWVTGSEEIDENLKLTFCAKVFDEGSDYGINEGKISKLEIRFGGEIVCNYDRGWDVRPTKEVKPFYDSILAEFN
jgi:hypothetical protein